MSYAEQQAVADQLAHDLCPSRSVVFESSRGEFVVQPDGIAIITGFELSARLRKIANAERFIRMQEIDDELRALRRSATVDRWRIRELRWEYRRLAGEGG